MLAASSVGHAGCVCKWQQRGQIDLLTVSVSQQTKIMACSKPDKKLIPKIANLRQSELKKAVCTETVAFVKDGNVKRHYETKHAHFEQKYPQNSEVRGRKINHPESSYQATCSVMVIISHTTRACIPQHTVVSLPFQP